MGQLFGSLIVLALFAYFYSKGSDKNAKLKTSIKFDLSPPAKSSSQDLGSTPTSLQKPSTNSTPSTSRESAYSTTGEFVRSTEGYIPTDRCECGGQWVKHVNKKTGGRFFGCSRYPTCDNTRDKQQAENFCSNGHARNSQNTAYNSDGSRRCLICRPYPKENSERYFPESSTEFVSSKPSTNSSKQLCKNGHIRTEENTYIRPNGERECRICRKHARS